MISSPGFAYYTVFLVLPSLVTVVALKEVSYSTFLRNKQKIWIIYERPTKTSKEKKKNGKSQVDLMEVQV